MDTVNFDGSVTGETARALVQMAQRVKRSPHDLLQDLVRYGLGEMLDGDAKDADVKVEPWTCNTGGGGFHTMTLVADGYGYLVAENSAGEEIVRIRATDHGASMDSGDDYAKLARKAMDQLERR